MASIFDNIRNLFGGQKEQKQVYRKEAPVVYYNSVNTSYQQKTRYDQLSEEGYSENAIVKKCIDAYYKYDADKITAEVNNGGDLVEKVVRTIDMNVNFGSVRATKGK